MKTLSGGAFANDRFEGAVDGPTNQGPEPARVICIHASPTIIGEFLE